MTRWIRRILTGAVSAALIAALAAPAAALGEIELDTPGGVTLNVTESELREDLAETAAVVFVYKVADVDESGTFTLTDRFAALADDPQWNDGHLGGNTRLQDLQESALALLLAETPEAPAEADEESEAALPEPDVQVETALTGGEVPLDSLGLYLLAPQGVETEEWSYTFNPILLAVPSADQESGEWMYECAVSMKAERESRLTGIVIQKTLQNYNATLGPTTFLFEVRAEKDGELVYSNVAALTMSGPGTQSVTVEGIPAGAHVTVTEVYSGASYSPVGGQVSVEVEDLPLPEDGQEYARVPFTNDYNNRRVPDSAVTNTFVYDGTGWQWQSSQEAGQ